MPIPGTFQDPPKKLTDDPGVTAPIAISALAVSGIGGGSATVTWTTSIASSSRVSYGPAVIGRAQTTAETDKSPLVTSHSVVLSGLQTGKTYSYRVHSRQAGGKDGAGNSVLDGYQATQDGQFAA